jgi:hypothetical protein
MTTNWPSLVGHRAHPLPHCAKHPLAGAIYPPLAYISGPYRSQHGPYGVQHNIAKARELAEVLWQRGYAVICPHMNTANMDGVICPGSSPEAMDKDSAGFLAGDMVMLSRCDLIVMLPGWEYSEGAKTEHNGSVETGLPVYYADEGLPPVIERTKS